MAINDNTSYELFGYQVKDLATKIKSKAESASLAPVATSGLYSDLTGKPTIPTVYNGTLTIQQNGTTVDTFTANSSTNKTVNIETITAETVAPAEEIGSITADMIDWSTLSILTARGSSGDSSVSANTAISLSVVTKIGTKITATSNTRFTIGAGVTHVLVSANAFYSGSGGSYAWFEIRKNGSAIGGSTAIANITNSSFCSASFSEQLVAVQEGDYFEMWNKDARTVRGTSTWMTIKALG